ncbi:MAG: hypothetical protein II661_02435 [Bacteroidales bacterium]|nr:hypothetical protein [Bacteroidales bacterium]
MASIVLKDMEGNPIATADLKAFRRQGSEPFAYRYENKWMGWLKRTKAVSTPKIFYALTELMRAGTNEVYISPKDKATILTEYGLSGVSFWAAMKELESEKVILRGDIVDPDTGAVVRELGRSVVLLNPYIVWKGRYTDRSVAIAEFDTYLSLIKRAEEQEYAK